MDKCPKCNGTGMVGGWLGNILIDYDCHKCDGVGEVIDTMNRISETLTWMEKTLEDHKESGEDDK